MNSIKHNQYLIFSINEDYLNFLRQIDFRISDPKKYESVLLEGRPYIGIIVEIENSYYYAPLSSKAKLKVDQNGKLIKINITDVYLFRDGIETLENSIGVIKMNNCVPIPKNHLNELTKVVNINDCKQSYRNLLMQQYEQLKTEKVIKDINWKAEKFVLSYDKLRPSLQILCVDNKFLNKHVIDTELYFKNTNERNKALSEIKTLFNSKYNILKETVDKIKTKREKH